MSVLSILPPAPNLWGARVHTTLHQEQQATGPGGQRYPFPIGPKRNTRHNIPGRLDRFGVRELPRCCSLAEPTTTSMYRGLGLGAGPVQDFCHHGGSRLQLGRAAGLVASSWDRPVHARCGRRRARFNFQLGQLFSVRCRGRAGPKVQKRLRGMSIYAVVATFTSSLRQWAPGSPRGGGALFTSSRTVSKMTRQLAV